MAYSDASHGPNRTRTIATVAIIHAGLGYALLTGFAGGVIDTIKQTTIGTTFIEDEVEIIPLDPIEQPKDDVREVPVPDTRIVPMDSPLDRTSEFVLPKVPVPDTFPTGRSNEIVDLPVEATQPAPLYKPRAAAPRGNPGSWVTQDDYPSRMIRRGIEGTTDFRLTIDARGRVTDCTVTSSSGAAELDKAACTSLSRRAKFEAARDGNGDAIPGTYSSRIVWRLP